jgi:hypothetical protein
VQYARWSHWRSLIIHCEPFSYISCVLQLSQGLLDAEAFGGRCWLVSQVLWSGKKYVQATRHLLRLLQILKQQQAMVAAEQMRVSRAAGSAAAEEKQELAVADAGAKAEEEMKARQNSAAEKLVAFFRGIVVRKKGLEYKRQFKIDEPLGMSIEHLQVEELVEDGQASKVNVKVGTFVVAVNGTPALHPHCCVP